MRDANTSVAGRTGAKASLLVGHPADALPAQPAGEILAVKLLRPRRQRIIIQSLAFALALDTGAQLLDDAGQFLFADMRRRPDNQSLPLQAGADGFRTFVAADHFHLHAVYYGRRAALRANEIRQAEPSRPALGRTYALLLHDCFEA